MSLLRLLHVIPKNHLSNLFGRIAGVPLPGFVLRSLIRLYSKHYQVNLEEMSHSIGDYKSLADFFTRSLKPGSRPIDQGIVSPADGRLVGCGSIIGDRIEQVKGRDYSLIDFLGSEQLARHFTNGVYFTVYLAPGDYHWVHAPISGEICEVIHIPGSLWPVNDWSVHHVKNLFAVNERVHVLMNSKLGKVVVSFVGATNVGSIKLSFTQKCARILANEGQTDNSLLKTNDCSPWFSTLFFGRKRNPVRYSVSGASLDKGDKLGVFELGSTVVLLFEKGSVCPLGDGCGNLPEESEQKTGIPGRPAQVIRCGQSIASSQVE